MELFRIFGRIAIDDGNAVNTMENVTSKAKSLAGGIGKFAMGVGAMAVAAGVAIGGLVAKTSEQANEINKLSQQTGTTTEEYQRLDGAMKSVGFSMEEASGDISALGEKALEAMDATSGSAESFKKLGVSVLDSSGNLRSQGDILNDTITGLQGMEDITMRNAMASDLLGTSGEELVPILNMTSEALGKLKGNVDVISEDDLNTAKEFNEKWMKIKTQFVKVGMTLGLKLMPVINKLFDFLDKNAPVIDKIITSMFELSTVLFESLFKVIEENIMPILEVLFKWISENMPMIKMIFQLTFEYIAFVINIVVTIIEIFIKGLEGLYKVCKWAVNGILEIWKSDFAVVSSIIEGIVDSIEWMIDKIRDALEWLGLLHTEQGVENMTEKEKAINQQNNKIEGIKSGHYGTDLIYGSVPMTSETTYKQDNIFSKAQPQESAINIENMTVREEADIDKISKKLYDLKKRDSRGKGVK